MTADKIRLGAPVLPAASVRLIKGKSLKGNWKFSQEWGKKKSFGEHPGAPVRTQKIPNLGSQVGKTTCPWWRPLRPVCCWILKVWARRNCQKPPVLWGQSFIVARMFLPPVPRSREGIRGLRDTPNPPGHQGHRPTALKFCSFSASAFAPSAKFQYNYQ